MRKQILLCTADEAFTALLRKAVRTLRVNLESFSPAARFNMTQLALIQSADLLLLDFEDLPQSVFEQLSTNTERPPVLIFTNQYTVQQYKRALALQPRCFLTKTGPPLQIRQAIELFFRLSTKPKKISPPPGAASVMAAHHKVYIKTRDKFKPLIISDITFAFSENKTTYVRIDQQNHPTSYKLKELEKLLSPVLVRAHRSFLVNPSHITMVFPKREQIEIEGTLIPIGSRYRKSLFDHIRVL